jgi:hypothetical protein
VSRSKKKHPFGYCGRSEKQWKRDVNRKMRRVCHQLTDCQAEWNFDLLFPIIDEIGNVYNSPKDGNARYRPYDQKSYERWALDDLRVVIYLKPIRYLYYRAILGK